MDYSKLSDFEINKRVAHALGNAQVNQVHDEISGSGVQFTIYKKSGLNREGLIVMHPFTATKDFCNKPEDAWPIIVDKKIGIKPVRWNEWRAEGDDSCGFLSYTQTDKNPLRAAMIVFLMMQDSANVPANSTWSDIR
ncbi:DUF2591 domain-containing protein [Salmonella enterica]|nr:hypothetical protein [Salmonella enterica]EBP0973166.1 DUF2591 domain-containing protein [Salmonella enterica]EED3357013.1 DUF2591 domain-containing protein [Salmonella enterica subsp. enterica]